MGKVMEGRFVALRLYPSRAMQLELLRKEIYLLSFLYMISMSQGGRWDITTRIPYNKPLYPICSLFFLILYFCRMCHDAEE